MILNGYFDKEIKDFEAWRKGLRMKVLVILIFLIGVIFSAGVAYLDAAFKKLVIDEYHYEK